MGLRGKAEQSKYVAIDRVKKKKQETEREREREGGAELAYFSVRVLFVANVHVE